MRNPIKAIVLTVPLLLLAAPSLAQTLSAQQLRTQLQNAVCVNNWSEALSSLGQLMGSSEATPQYRQQLLGLRRQLEEYRANQSQFDRSNDPACATALANASAAATAQPTQRSSLDWERAIGALGGSNSSTPAATTGSGVRLLNASIEQQGRIRVVVATVVNRSGQTVSGVRMNYQIAELNFPEGRVGTQVVGIVDGDSAIAEPYDIPPNGQASISWLVNTDAPNLRLIVQSLQYRDESGETQLVSFR